MEDLVSRGHRYQDVVDGYPVGLVLNFHRAARLNRRLLVADLAVGVSLGIRDAFAKEGKLVQTWAQEIEASGAGVPAGGPLKNAAANPLSPWTNHLPIVKRKKRHG